MVDAEWGDDSEFQIPVDDRYPYRSWAGRTNDGTYLDHHWGLNHAYAKHACDTGRWDWFMSYLVYEPNWMDTFTNWAHQLGRPHPKMAAMIDMEKWGGRLSGDHSRWANALRKECAGYLGSYMTPLDRAQGKHWKRVGGYGNAGDLNSLWAGRPRDMWIGLADYNHNPSFPGKLFHQFASNFNVPPFGPSDINSADGMSYLQVAKALGLDTTPSVNPTPHPPPPPAPVIQEDNVFIAYIDENDCKAAGIKWLGMFSTDLTPGSLVHLTSRDLNNLRAAGIKDLPQPMSLAMYYKLGGK